MKLFNFKVLLLFLKKNRWWNKFHQMAGYWVIRNLSLSVIYIICFLLYLNRVGCVTQIYLNV